ncbi:hypothetical protein ACQJBY_031162 [Aegilops geniculata]
MEQQRREPAPETEVTLREFTEADAEALFAWASDPRVVLFQRREAYARVDEARRYIRDHVLPHPWYRAICLDAVPVGSISVKPCPTDEGLRRASLGYRVAHGYWGRGIATRAVRMAAAAAFAEWPWLLRLEAVADVENPASQRVLEKAGFVREGVLRRYVVLKGRPRDMVMFSLVHSELQVTEPFELNKDQDYTGRGGRGAMDPDGDARHHEQRRRREEEEGPVVSLRPLGLADVDEFMAWASDDRVMRHLKRPLCHTREQAVAQIRDTVLGHPWFRAICVAGRPVGQVSVWPYPDDGGHRANLGYALAHGHWGRGIAPAAIRMVTYH